MSQTDTIQSTLWAEKPESADPYTAAQCLAAGYDVYADLLGKATWIEYLFLLFQQQRPTADQAALLNHLAVAIGCLGPRDHSTQAAMSAAASGSTLASCLMAGLAVNAGQLGGAREVYHMILAWEAYRTNLTAWHSFLAQPWPQASNNIWPDLDHPPGFNPNGSVCPTPVTQTLAILCQFECAQQLKWLTQHRETLEKTTQMPLSFSGVASCALSDLGFDPQQGEMLFLLLRLPGTAALTLEQHWRGWQAYPFYQDKLIVTNDPGNPNPET